MLLLIVISHIETLEGVLFVVEQSGAYGKYYRYWQKIRAKIKPALFNSHNYNKGEVSEDCHSMYDAS